MNTDDQRPDLSIVIVSYNTRDLTRQCLKSIYESTTGITFEITVVDNHSSDSSPRMIQEGFPNVHLVVNNENLGLAAATNQGMAQSRGRYLLSLNSDTVVLPGAFEILVRAMDEHPNAGGATPRLLRPDGSPHPAFCGSKPSLKSELLDLLGPVSSKITKLRRENRFSPEMDYGKTQEIPCVLCGTCFIVRKEVVDSVGLQDSRFFIYAEDVDWSMRISKAGWKLYYVAEAQVIHYGGQSTKQASTKMTAQLLKSRCLLIHKQYNVFAGLILKLAITAVYTIRLIKWILLYPVKRAKASEIMDETWKILRRK